MLSIRPESRSRLQFGSNIMKKVFYILALAVFLNPGSTNGRLLINEVMSNEPGGDRLLEWVELWNFSDSALSLSGLSFVDEDDTTAFDDSVTLEAYAFFVLTRNAGRFEEYWGDSSGTWGDSELEDYRLLECRMSLRNDHDSVLIVDERGEIVSFCEWSSSSPDGVSYERADPRDDESSASWESCRSADGSTPGAMNSVTPGNNDLRLTATFDIDGAYREILTAFVTVKNIGLSASDSNELRLGADLDGDRNLNEQEVIFREIIPPIAILDSVDLTITETFSPERYDIVASLLPDDDPTNNDTLVSLRFGVQPFEVAINEVLADPDSPLESEWVELYNTSDNEIDLAGWSLCDSVGCAQIKDANIGGKDYLILCQDAVAFRAHYAEINTDAVGIEGWRSLNNTGDVVYLTDEAGLTVDSMCYETGFGDNVSWERIDPQVVGCDLSNWYRSTASTGSTPGEANSVRSGFSSGFSVELDSKIISPDGDGFDDILTIRYEIPRSSMLSLRIFDLNGNVVKTIFENEYLSSGEYEYDGSGDYQSGLEVGMYILLAELSGGVESARKIVFAVVGRE